MQPLNVFQHLLKSGDIDLFKSTQNLMQMIQGSHHPPPLLLHPHPCMKGMCVAMTTTKVMLIMYINLYSDLQGYPSPPLSRPPVCMTTSFVILYSFLFTCATCSPPLSSLSNQHPLHQHQSRHHQDVDNPPNHYNYKITSNDQHPPLVMNVPRVM